VHEALEPEQPAEGSQLQLQLELAALRREFSGNVRSRADAGA
jgi:hypothetical protein